VDICQQQILCHLADKTLVIRMKNINLRDRLEYLIPPIRDVNAPLSSHRHPSWLMQIDRRQHRHPFGMSCRYDNLKTILEDWDLCCLKVPPHGTRLHHFGRRGSRLDNQCRHSGISELLNQWLNIRNRKPILARQPKRNLSAFQQDRWTKTLAKRVQPIE